ncbi:MAG: glutathione S-transferase family protein [Caulobacter sp.]|nr:glutathione S-transferase family protein [Caulobacter sp.]
MNQSLTVYGALGSGSVPVEAALTLIGQPFEVIEGATWEHDPEVLVRVRAVNPLVQIPAVVLPSGEIITESGAILIWLADAYPQARLGPAVGDPRRAQFLRWISFVASIYGFYWVKDDPSRLAPDPAAQPVLVERSEARILDCWAAMNSQISPGRYILGDELTVLDLYVTVVSRFRPRRQRFYQAAPKLEAVVKAVDADPRLADFWPRRYPFASGWER